MDFVDDTEVRKEVKMTAKAGLSYVDAQKGDSKLPHRYMLTKKHVPALDKKLDEKVSKAISGLIEETGALLISDGWTSIQSRPIINALLSTPVGAKFLKAIDTSGQIKNAQFIADFIIEMVTSVGPENVVGVCMDGACKASFSIIEERFPHINCFICLTHSLDNFLKTVCETY